MRDDWMDVFDVEESLSRIKKESLPLPLLYSLQHLATKDKLRSIFLRKAVTRKDAEYILENIQKTDGLQKNAKLMSELAEDAILNLRKQGVKSKDLETIIKATLPLLIETKSRQGV